MLTPGGFLPIKFLLTTAYARLPQQSHPGDAGFDLFADDTVTIEPGQWADVPSGVCMQLPDGFWASIEGRSSSLIRRRLQVQSSVIDNGYRGKLYAFTYNCGTEPQTIEQGERIAQIVPHRVETDYLQPVAVDHLDEHVRGTAGLGSTGK